MISTEEADLVNLIVSCCDSALPSHQFIDFTYNNAFGLYYVNSENCDTVAMITNAVSFKSMHHDLCA